MKIFFDFDGTLIDSRLRLYSLFKELVRESTLSFEEYWELKRNKISHKDILIKYYNYDAYSLNNFNSKWFSLIEEETYLAFDTPIEGITNYLKQLHVYIDLYLITSRQYQNKVTNQLAQFGWESFFKDALVTEQEKEKEELIQEFYKCSENDFLVGDTCKDIETGNLLGVKTIAVLSGFHSKIQLAKYKPTFIVEKIVDFDFLTQTAPKFRKTDAGK